MASGWTGELSDSSWKGGKPKFAHAGLGVLEGGNNAIAEPCRPGSQRLSMACRSAGGPFGMDVLAAVLRAEQQTQQTNMHGYPPAMAPSISSVKISSSPAALQFGVLQLARCVAHFNAAVCTVHC